MAEDYELWESAQAPNRGGQNLHMKTNGGGAPVDRDWERWSYPESRDFPQNSIQVTPKC
jgi:hypothetical protein